MRLKSMAGESLHYLRTGLAFLALFQFTLGAPFVGRRAG